MAQIVTGTRGAIVGSFDVTSAGADPVTGKITGGSLLAQQRQALARVKAFAAGLKRLESRHLNKAYLQQLASAGPSSLPEITALLSLPNLTGINNNAAQIAQFGTGVGQRAANYVYGAQERSLAGQEARETRLANHLASQIAHQLTQAVTRIERRPVLIQVDGRTILKVTREAEKKANR
jgi:hypothetical protein